MELEDLLITELDQIKNFKSFCIQHNITKSQYIKISQIRHKKNKKKYTDLVVKLLNLFGYQVVNNNYFRVIKYGNTILNTEKGDLSDSSVKGLS